MNAKTILGLDLGTTSIGWALVKEAITPDATSEIIKLGVRVNPLTADEKSDFAKGANITTNANRTLKRSMRRNLQRYKLRREELIAILQREGWIDESTVLAENSNQSTFETWRLRAMAASEPITLQELARVLLMLNKKRGYKSSRKAKSAEEGEIIDGMQVAKQLYEQDLTPGQHSYQLLLKGKKSLPDYYRSDLQAEFECIWNKQASFYPIALFNNDLKNKLQGCNEKQTWAILKDPWNLVGLKPDKKGLQLKLEQYRQRANAIQQQLSLEELAIVLQKINRQINNASGYLGAISDHSKLLSFNHQNIGQYQMVQLQADPHHSLKNIVFYRADYLDEFEQIWETQAKFHSELTPELKKRITRYCYFLPTSVTKPKRIGEFL